MHAYTIQIFNFLLKVCYNLILGQRGRTVHVNEMRYTMSKRKVIFHFVYIYKRVYNTLTKESRFV